MHPYVDSYAIKAEGVEVAEVPTLQEANKALVELENYYAPQDDFKKLISVEFQENVTTR